MSSKLVPLIIPLVTAAVLPFLLWAGLAAAVRGRPGRIARLYPWVKAVAVTAWIAAIAAIAIELVLGNFRPRVWPFVTIFSAGVQLVHGWARRQVEPDAGKEPPDGWWPTPNKF